MITVVVDARRSKLWPRLLVAAAVVAVGAIAIWQLPVATWAVSLAERLRGMGAAGVALFAAVYVLAVIALVPGAPLTMAAGFAYGPIGGFLVASPASVVAATLAFLLARSAIRERIRRVIDRHPVAGAIDRAVTEQPVRLILLLRLSPVVPFNLLNYALGLSTVGLGRYVAASFVGMIPGTFLNVYLGSLLTTAAQLGQGREQRSPGEWALLAVGLAATVAAVVVITRAARRALDSELPIVANHTDPAQRVHAK